MKSKLIASLVLAGAAVLCAPLAEAQGVIVHLKSGSNFHVPYTELDSISTYDYNAIEGMITFEVNGVTFDMVFVEGGTFEMGDTLDQSNGSTSNSDEYSDHTVTLSSYHIGQTEVTQELWFAVMNESPVIDHKYNWTSTYGLGAKYPSYNISYYDCREFIGKLNQLTGASFRMPTEAEWEYAARGGKYSQGYIYSGSNSIEDVAWYAGNSGRHNHEVATKAPNELGLYDMSGNVGEWCYSADVICPHIRGSFWFSEEQDCQISQVGGAMPDSRGENVGFRLAL